jgi:hypothetical protein
MCSSTTVAAHGVAVFGVLVTCRGSQPSLTMQLSIEANGCSIYAIKVHHITDAGCVNHDFVLHVGRCCTQAILGC